MEHKLPQLPYALNALEPVISEAIMDVHYNKHHAAYVNNLNAALKKSENASLDDMIVLQSAIKFNGGGHINHSLFWENLAPKGHGGGGAPSGKLAETINQTFGSFNVFKEKFTEKAVGVQGSGWAWLAFSPADKKIVIATCPNQDPVSSLGLIPLMGVDVWEHAYYLQYKNARVEYLKAIWDVIAWKKVEERFHNIHVS